MYRKIFVPIFLHKLSQSNPTDSSVTNLTVEILLQRVTYFVITVRQKQMLCCMRERENVGHRTCCATTATYNNIEGRGRREGRCEGYAKRGGITSTPCFGGKFKFSLVIRVLKPLQCSAELVLILNSKYHINSSS